MSYRSEAALLTLWYKQITLLSKEIISNIQQSHIALSQLKLTCVDYTLPCTTSAQHLLKNYQIRFVKILR